MREIEEYKPSARELVFCLTSEFQWLEVFPPAPPFLNKKTLQKR